MTAHLPGGLFPLAHDLTVTRFGYGAMQLAGPRVFGPPADPDAARAVLREVVALGITHIDTADFYGPVHTNALIEDTLFPYPEHLHIATKVGSLRDERGRWPQALQATELRQAVYDNLNHLTLDVLDLVNLRVGAFDSPTDGSLEEPFTALAELQQEGLIRHLGVSNVTAAQVAEARTIAPIVSVQNHYNLARRGDDALIDELAADGIAYVPYFPLGGFSPLQSETLARVATDLGSAPLPIALAWLLQRSPNMLAIAGTSSVDHLRENVTGARIRLPEGALAELDAIGR